MYQSIFKENLFQDQVIIITGGGSGIGRCTAHELAALGAKVILIGRRKHKLEEVSHELSLEGFECDYYEMDIRELDSVEETIAAIINKHGQINGLVNNAGGQFPSPLKDISDNGWEAVIRNNLTGGFRMMREVYNQWMAEHGGSIVNIVASVSFGMPHMGHTGAARAGMINLTQTAALEWVHSGVRINAVSPGSVASSGMETYPEEFKKKLKQRRHQTPMKRQATEAEISSAIVYLLSDGAAYITGHTIAVDGGLPLAKENWTVPEHSRCKPFNGFHLYEEPAFLREPD
ncbi:MAG: 2,4-dienoyl-CoA reductase [Gammaproteobacteria bacterium]|nr:MAG: 2,4-dienoyl-CoA reductase [Gammaproteobacteria bacterium]RLA23512.1 MAG: 2,4-dienoyl-CoA reductase [Gammaproteobacteria bacterium]